MISAFAFAVGADPVPYLIQDSGAGSATLTPPGYLSAHSVYIDTGDNVPSGDMGMIKFVMPEGTILDDIETIRWKYFLDAGYPPHLDIYLDTEGSGTADDCLTFEYAENGATGTTPTYGATPGSWYTTFNDGGPNAVDDNAIAWSNDGKPDGSIPKNHWLHSLADWKAGVGSGDHIISGATTVLSIRVQMDSWLIRSQAHIDDIEINGVLYDFESIGPVSLTGEAVIPQISIIVSPTSIDFGRIVLGKETTPQPIHIDNTGEAKVTVTTELLEDDGFYLGCLKLDGILGSQTFTVDEGAAIDVTLLLDVPRGAAPGVHTAILVFWAEETPP